MEAETTLAAGIRAADEESKYDAVCKELLSEKIILAWILKTCAVEFAEYDVNEIAEKFIEGTPVISAEPVMRNESASKISGMGQVDATIMEGTVTYDIYFRAVLPKEEGVVELIVNVEAQGGRLQRQLSARQAGRVLQLPHGFRAVRAGVQPFPL